MRILFLVCDFRQAIKFLAAQGVDHVPEDALVILQQVVWRVEFDGSTGVHDKYAVGVDDRVEAMSHCEDGAIGELDANRLLNQTIGAVEEMKSSERFLGSPYQGVLTEDQHWLWLRPKRGPYFYAKSHGPSTTVASGQH